MNGTCLMMLVWIHIEHRHFRLTSVCCDQLKTIYLINSFITLFLFFEIIFKRLSYLFKQQVLTFIFLSRYDINDSIIVFVMKEQTHTNQRKRQLENQYELFFVFVMKLLFF